MNDMPLVDQLGELLDQALAADDDDLRELYDALREAVTTVHDELERREAPPEEDEEDEEEEDWLDDGDSDL